VTSDVVDCVICRRSLFMLTTKINRASIRQTDKQTDRHDEWRRGAHKTCTQLWHWPAWSDVSQNSKLHSETWLLNGGGIRSKNTTQIFDRENIRTMHEYFVSLKCVKTRTRDTDFYLDRFFWATRFWILFLPYFSFLGRALD